MLLIISSCLLISSLIVHIDAAPQYAPSSPGCRMEEKIIYEDKCEEYIEKTCVTKNERVCKQVSYEYCEGAIKQDVERQCFKVNEQFCIIQDDHLRRTSEEDPYVPDVVPYVPDVVPYVPDVVPYAPDVVGECLKSGELVCDTKFNVKSTTKNEHQCVDVRQPKCSVREKVVTDVTCVDSFEFKCQAGAYRGQIVCERYPTRNCSDSNRKVNVDYCEMGTVSSCLNFPKRFYSPVEEEVNCRQVPKPDPSFYGTPCYTKDCIDKSRNICDQYETENLKPVCMFTERRLCSYEPKERCSEKTKQYCTKVERVVYKQICDANFIFSYGRS